MPFPGAAEPSSQGAAVAGSSLDEVKRMRGQLSLKLLRNLDSHVDCILYQTPFVTAYELSSTEQWVRADIEGFLYVIQRSADPRHSFVLINRKSENHLVEYITPEFQMTLEENFIFYRSLNVATNTMNKIRGLWFFDPKECFKSFEKIDAVTINREPLSGFNKTEGSSGMWMTIGDASPIDSNSSKPPKAPAPSPEFSLSPDIFGARRKEGYIHPGVNAHMRRTSADEPVCRSPELGSSAIARFASHGGTVEPLGKDAQRLVSLLRPLATGTVPSQSSTDPPHSAHRTHSAHSMSFGDPAVQTARTDDTSITVTYSMLCRAFAEAFQSEEFLQIVWRRLREQGSRHGG